MAGDLTRASDSERERVVGRLRIGAEEGRLTIDELDERTARAYVARTRGELAELIEDLPVPRAAPPSAHPGQRLPWMPGRLAFSASWSGPSDPRQAGSDILEFVVPAMFAHGYD